MINILSIDNNVNWWRNTTPLRHLRRQFSDLINIKHVQPNVTIDEINQADAVIVFRPSNERALKFINNCHELGVPVIADLDDNIWQLPPGHPQAAEYGEIRSVINEIYSQVDLLWASTEEIIFAADAIGRSVVVKNAILPEDLPRIPTMYTGSVCWRGNNVQIDDLLWASPWFHLNRDKFQRWVWWGYLPPYDHTASSKLEKRVDVLEYFSMLKRTRFNLVWKPLVDNPFNAAKSNIAWLEATMCGAACVTNFAGRDGWEYALPEFTTDRDEIETAWQKSQVAILENYNLHDVNTVRMESIASLLNMTQVIT